MKLSDRIASDLSRARTKVASLKAELKHHEERVAFLEKSAAEARKFEASDDVDEEVKS